MPAFTIDDLLTWSQKLPDWQRDALRRVLSKNITSIDIAELSAMALAAQGLSTQAAPAPIPAMSSDVGPSTTPTPSVVLIAIRDIRHVNALAPGPVTFAPEGLTIIYGDNASGKSGIARILKKAGQARNPGGQILPSVFEPDPGQPASATIDFRIGTTDHSSSWVDGSPSDQRLSAINVFDASCGVIQIEAHNRLTYTPQILRVFHDLAQTCHAVADHLKAQHDAFSAKRSPELDQLTLRSDTAAGLLLSKLSLDTDPADIDALCNLTDADRQRFDQLRDALRDNPAHQADLVDARARRIVELDTLLAQLQSSFSDLALQEFENLVVEATTADQAANAARQTFAASSNLVGVGEQVWKQLWESARRYSEQLAYPARPFPVTAADALCVLCQQPLSTGTADRLRSFERFVQDDIQQRAEKKREDLQRRVDQLRTTRIPLSGVHLRETGLRGNPGGQAAKAFIVAAKLRRRHMMRRPKALPNAAIVPLPPCPDLAATRAALADQVKTLRAAAQTAERTKMQNEFAELDGRLRLAPLRDTLRNEIARLALLTLLVAARNACDTTWITRKAGEVAQIVVTDRLKSAFATNLAQLGPTTPPVEVKLGPGDIGQHPYDLTLIARQEIPPSQILSEGEKTCVALAGFLAELETSNNRSGIVFDDPISSLDHHYRVNVARRLVEAAKTRQVIVFTHDIVFLFALVKYVKASGVPFVQKSLLRGFQQHGVIEDGPPWVALPVKQRIGLLRSELQAAESSLLKGNRSTYDQKAERIFKRLRQSWERAVEEVLLNQVVLRFGDSVSTQRLKALTDIKESDIQLVETEMSFCSSFLHDESGAVNVGIPDPSVLKASIEKLDDWVAALRKRGRS